MRLKFIMICICLIYSLVAKPQVVESSVNNESYINYENVYNFMYWDNSWKSSNVERSFTNQTSSYVLNIDFTNLNINNLSIVTAENSPAEGFSELKSTSVQTNFDGEIEYAIYQNGNSVFSKSSSPTGNGRKDSQIAEFGVWSNKRFVSTNFTNDAPVDFYYSGVEFNNWHNRFKLTFHVKPTADISNAQLKFSVEIPEEYTEYLNTGDVHGFGQNNGAGFAVKGGATTNDLSISNNKITVTSLQQNLLANSSYEVSILFVALKNDFSVKYVSAFEEETQVNITAQQTDPVSMNISDISYNQDEGIHYIDIPRYGMGYNNCEDVNKLQKIKLSLENNASESKRARVCFRQIPSVNVVGFNSLICSNNGEPSGLPLQVSKNWHTSTNQYFSGSWIKEYTEFIIPANTTLHLNYIRTGAKWGKTYSVSSHQLSVAGAGVPRGGWLEASIGSFGENITHSPDYEYGNSNACDVRPFLVTNQNYGGTSKECFWTGNVGGFDMWVYVNEANKRQYQSEVKTRFLRYSPNLTETAVSAVSADRKLKLDYSFFLNRSDDFTRIYYKIKIKALQNILFNRFDIFQLGGDIYNIHNTQKLTYGNDEGKVGEISPNNNGSNNYTTDEIALNGENPWIWAGDGLSYSGANSGIDIDTNNGLIIRDYKATINGVENNTPYFRERSSSIGFSASQAPGENPTSYCLVLPPGTTSMAVNDEIELLVELAVLPKQNGDYYGTNTNFMNALEIYGNSYELLFREALGNKIIATSPSNSVSESYPLTVEVINNEGLVTVTGGKGYIPLKFTGISNIANIVLWKSYDNCWEVIDQSEHGNDFWQTDYNTEAKNFEVIFNVNQDVSDDQEVVVQYYLGATPPTPLIDPLSKLNNDDTTTNTTIMANDGEDTLLLIPQVRVNGNLSLLENGIDSNWIWTGPNGFSQIGREVTFNPITQNDEGVYRVTYRTEYGCSVSKEYLINVNTTLGVDGSILNDAEFKIFPNPLKYGKLYISEASYDTKVYDMNGKCIYREETSSQSFNLNMLQTGAYVVRFVLSDKVVIHRILLKK